jgi:hypothetical protein
MPNVFGKVAGRFLALQFEILGSEVTFQGKSPPSRLAPQQKTLASPLGNFFLSRLVRQDDTRTRLVGHKPINPLATQCTKHRSRLGGEYRAESHITFGPVSFCGSIGVSVDTAIVGVGGIAEDGVFTKVLQEATMTAGMIAAARRTIVLADSTKFNHKLLAHIASLEQIDILVTDAAPPPQLSEVLSEVRVQVIVAPPLNARRGAATPVTDLLH